MTTRAASAALRHLRIEERLGRRLRPPRGTPRRLSRSGTKRDSGPIGPLTFP